MTRPTTQRPLCHFSNFTMPTRKQHCGYMSDPKRQCLPRDSGVPQRLWLNKLNERVVFDCILQLLVVTSFCPETDMVRAGLRDGTIWESCLYFSYTDQKCRLSLFIQGADFMRLDDSVRWIEIIPIKIGVPCERPDCIYYLPQYQTDHDFMVGAILSMKWILGWLRSAVKFQVGGTELNHEQALLEAWQVHRATFLFLWFETVRHCRYSPEIHMSACTYNKWMESADPSKRKTEWLLTNDITEKIKRDTEMSMIPPTRDFLSGISKILKPGYCFQVTPWFTCIYLIWKMALMTALNHISPRFKNEQGSYCFIGGMKYHIQEYPHIFRPSTRHVDMVEKGAGPIGEGLVCRHALHINLKMRPYVGITGIFPMCAPKHGLWQLIYKKLHADADEEKTSICLPHVWFMIASCLYCRDAFVEVPYVGKCNKDTDEAFVALLKEEFGE